MKTLVNDFILGLLLISIPVSIITELRGYHIPFLHPSISLFLIIIVLLYRFFAYLYVIQRLDVKINLFYWKFLTTLRKTEIAKRIKYEMQKGDFILLSSLGCGLDDYQHELSVLTRENHIKKLC